MAAESNAAIDTLLGYGGMNEGGYPSWVHCVPVHLHGPFTCIRSR
jgi:hypothetical protein